MQALLLDPWVRENPMKKGMATHSHILAWRIPWTEEPGRLQSTGMQKSSVQLSNSHNSSNRAFYHCCQILEHSSQPPNVKRPLKTTTIKKSKFSFWANTLLCISDWEFLPFQWQSRTINSLEFSWCFLSFKSTPNPAPDLPILPPQCSLDWLTSHFPRLKCTSFLV